MLIINVSFVPSMCSSARRLHFMRRACSIYAPKNLRMFNDLVEKAIEEFNSVRPCLNLVVLLWIV